MAFVQATFSDPRVPDRDRVAALNRAFADPGIPAPQGTPSFWLRNPHSSFQIQSSSLPVEADIVIIGSGITGASIARTLLTHASTNRDQKETAAAAAAAQPSILILDGRDICHGATGRNGGHILETAEEFAYFEETYGVEAAIRTMRFRLAHLAELLQVAEEYGLSEVAQARRVQFLSVYFDEARWAETVRSVRRLKECMPAETKEWMVYGKGEISEDFHLSPTACGLITGPAGALWPYRFVTGLLAKLRDQYPDTLRIESRTPVTAITENTGNFRYAVTTPRGSVRARHVIHCTNAHVGHLVPGLRGRIYPIQGTMTAQDPPRGLPPQGTRHSWLFNYEYGFDYLTQLPEASWGGEVTATATAAATANKMMLGGGFGQHVDRGVWALGVARDDGVVPGYTVEHLRGTLGKVFAEKKRKEGGDADGQGLEMAWTGNMGFSADGYPWIGKLPSSATERGNSRDDKDHGHGAEWLSCAFSGEGMVQAWLCGKAVGMMVLAHEGRLAGEELDLSWVPEQMFVSEERMRRSVLARVIPDQRASQL
ncbi:NAD(P)/FAD-dependent oxidoreductase [Aspergillus saccharolyticus JOP 1030-1]|uniref:FAD dependent oxidoreductase n=1 Tax=Aspergillus saccharolyticus JOP 1030-1 TaxID=1450539 RepID=A0A318ZHG2_9EURO|nr:FAD dependent oxidoreductase [Aspergillus saccharolyticus JOP 1030-1]PYH46929.1 FAD dependent oxidoreductase [Aspergillus saccharolyticus JOP 1030-1]